jgi:aldehyde:ferredoxin oxidoreductase
MMHYVWLEWQILKGKPNKHKAVVKEYDVSMARNFLGGRGFAAKILWDELKPNVDPLSPENRLIFAHAF